MTDRKMPAYVRALRNRNGATSAALRAKMNRVYAPTAYQLRPVADRYGFVLASRAGADGLLRYAFKRNETEASAFAHAG